jgi:hypothetical protein
VRRVIAHAWRPPHQGLRSDAAQGGRTRIHHGKAATNGNLSYMLSIRFIETNGPRRSGLATSVHAPGNASTQKHCQSSDGPQAGGSVVLDVAKWLCVFAVVEFGSYAGQLGIGDGAK